MKGGRPRAAGILARLQERLQFPRFDLHERREGRAKIKNRFRAEEVEELRQRDRRASRRLSSHAVISRRPAVVPIRRFGPVIGVGLKDPGIVGRRQRFRRQGSVRGPRNHAGFVAGNATHDEINRTQQRRQFQEFPGFLVRIRLFEKSSRDDRHRISGFHPQNPGEEGLDGALRRLRLALVQRERELALFDAVEDGDEARVRRGAIKRYSAPLEADVDSQITEILGYDELVRKWIDA